MFSVENADFIADKLASELLPDQEFREVAKNAEEASTAGSRSTASGTAASSSTSTGRCSPRPASGSSAAPTTATA